MEEQSVESWEAFIKELSSLDERLALLKNESELYISNYLFRGQANSEWSLNTTLDRFVDTEISINEYYRLAFAAKPQIETFTDRR